MDTLKNLMERGECKCKFDRTKCKSNQSWNNDKC